MTTPCRGGLLAATLLWIAAFVGARLWLKSGLLPDGLRLSVALLPLPFFAFVLWEVMHDIGRQDELGRRIHLEALAVAFPLSILLLMTLGLAAARRRYS